MKTYKRQLFFTIVMLLAGAPAQAAAGSLQITEVMYNPPGTGGAQWVEVYNPNASAAVMTAGTKGWRVDDGSASKHVLVDPAAASPGGGRGTLTIAPGGFAIITNDPAGFIAQYGSAAYSVIKSAIAPKVSGATISLFDSAGTVVASATYTKDQGAYNDGNSLHLKGNSLVAATPDPGVFSEQIASPNVSPSPAPEASTTPANDLVSTAQTTQQGSSVLNAPPLAARIVATSPVVVGAGSAFAGSAFTEKGDPVASARYLWNFGDGVTLEGQKVFHTYMYPGTYALSLSVSSGYSMGAGYTTLQAVPPQIALQVMQDGSVVVSNGAAQNTNIGLWSLGKSAGVFIIPENTLVLAKQSIRFAPAVMHFSTATDTALFYPNGVLAAVSGAAPPAEASAPASMISLPVSTVPPTSMKTLTTPAQAPAHAASKPASQAPSSNQPALRSGEEVAAVAHAVPQESSSILWESLAGLGALVVLGVLGVWYGKPLLPGTSSKESIADDFSIEDE